MQNSCSRFPNNWGFLISNAQILPLEFVLFTGTTTLHKKKFFLQNKLEQPIQHSLFSIYYISVIFLVYGKLKRIKRITKRISADCCCWHRAVCWVFVPVVLGTSKNGNFAACQCFVNAL